MLFETEENVVRRVGTFDNAIGLDYASSGLYIDDKGNVGSDHKYDS